MKIHPFRLGELQANCYLLEQDGEALLIDPADDANFILEELQRRNLTLAGILATHGHFDHCMAAGEVQMSYDVGANHDSPIPFYISQKDQFLIDRLESTAEHFLGYKPVILKPKIINYLSPGQFQISNFKLHILFTPGHTPGSVCYYFPEEQAVFTGDTLFAGAVGRTDLSYSSKPDLKTSLARLFALPEETTVYPGHGEETTILQERSSGAP